MAQVHLPALPPTTCMALGKLLDFLVHQFLHLQNGTTMEPTSQVMLIELIHTTHLGLYLALVCTPCMLESREKEREGGRDRGAILKKNHKTGAIILSGFQPYYKLL